MRREVVCASAYGHPDDACGHQRRGVVGAGAADVAACAARTAHGSWPGETAAAAKASSCENELYPTHEVGRERGGRDPASGA